MTTSQPGGKILNAGRIEDGSRGPAQKTLRWWLGREWRRAATGLCFGTFMSGGLFLSLTVLPIIRILPISASSKQRKGLALVHGAFGLFIKLMRGCGVIGKFEVEGLANLEGEGPFLFIANHPTLIDVVAILGSVPRCNCIVKKALFHHPFMGPVLRGTGFLPNDTGMHFIEGPRQFFDAGYSLMVFPEGTRSPRRGLHPFTRGAAQIAVRTGARVVPILIQCEPPTLMKGQAWYEVPDRAIHLKLSFQEPLPAPSSVTEESAVPLKVRRLNRYFELYFRERLGLFRTPGATTL